MIIRCALFAAVITLVNLFPTLMMTKGSHEWSLEKTQFVILFSTYAISFFMTMLGEVLPSKNKDTTTGIGPLQWADPIGI